MRGKQCWKMILCDISAYLESVFVQDYFFSDVSIASNLGKQRYSLPTGKGQI